MKVDHVAVVILNWKKPVNTLTCLAEFGQNATVAVVDNRSTDQTPGVETCFYKREFWEVKVRETQRCA